MNRPPGPSPRRKGLTRPRGQPLLALVLLMASWVGARAALWEPPQHPVQAKPEPAATAKVGTAPANKPALAPKRRQSDPLPLPRITPDSAPRPVPTFDPVPQAEAAKARRQREVMLQAEDHHMLWQVASQMPLAEREANLARPAAPLIVPAMLAAPSAGPAPANQADRPEPARWSADAWLLLRPGGNQFNSPGTGLPGAVVPAGFYGGSQAGAVLRYRLAPSSGWRPTLYLRAASGIEKPRGEEAALGFAFRPLARLPVSAMIEGRATRTITGTIVRPAAALVTELPPARLPGGLRAEAYLQGGYVGGQGATGFVDGQARVEKPLAQLGRFRLRAGGGAWGGAQRGARRLDIGPTAMLELPLGGATSRLSADYRFRVAGAAAPGSGPAVTVSVGF